MAELTKPTLSEREGEVLGRVPTGLWIDGEWRGGSAGTLDVRDPSRHGHAHVGRSGCSQHFQRVVR
jgi:hypothetical protein